VESLFIAYRLTGDPKYRAYGWKIFEAIQKHCRVEEGGYASILNVESVSTLKIDKMETFFMVRSSLFHLFFHSAWLMVNLQSETLKYLYLLFSDASILPLDRKPLFRIFCA